METILDYPTSSIYSHEFLIAEKEGRGMKCVNSLTHHHWPWRWKKGDMNRECGNHWKPKMALSLPLARKPEPWPSSCKKLNSANNPSEQEIDLPLKSAKWDEAQQTHSFSLSKVPTGCCTYPTGKIVHLCGICSNLVTAAMDI